MSKKGITIQFPEHIKKRLEESKRIIIPTYIVDGDQVII
jgi:hypothetical protein